MSEMPSFEQPEVKKEDVIAAFKKFVDRGITSPDALDLNDPEVVEANRLLDSWWEKEEKSAPEGDKMANHVRTMIMVDAGFTDPRNLRVDMSRVFGETQDRLAYEAIRRPDMFRALLEVLRSKRY